MTLLTLTASDRLTGDCQGGVGRDRGSARCAAIAEGGTNEDHMQFTGGAVNER